MRSGLRGGKPRDMATFKKGGTSRGAGAAKKGFDYAIYKKGGKVKKYADGGALRDKETGDYVRDPLTGTRQYASFGDLMGDLFGKKKEAPKAESAEPVRPRNLLPARSEEPEAQRPPGAARESLPTAQRARMQRRRPAGPGFLPSDEAVTGPARSRIPRPMSEDEREAEYPTRVFTPTPEEARAQRSQEMLRQKLLTRAAQNALAPGLYRKGGVVKKAGGGSCRGMGAAQRGGKYSIK